MENANHFYLATWGTDFIKVSAIADRHDWPLKSMMCKCMQHWLSILVDISQLLLWMWNDEGFSISWQLPPSWLKCKHFGVVCMQIVSFSTNSMIQSASCSILVSSQRMVLSSVHAYITMADLSMKPLMHVSLYHNIAYHCIDFSVSAMLKSGPTLHSLLTKARYTSLQRSKLTSSMKCHVPVERCTSKRVHTDSKDIWRSIRMCASNSSWTSLP